MPSLAKTERHELLLHLIDTRSIRTQEELARELSQAGVATTQASLSRDLRELGVVKQEGRYRRPLGPGRDLGLADALRFFLRAVAPVPPNLVVVQTAVGAAPEVGSLIDHAGWPEIRGTVAGDDTVFVAVPTAAAGARVAARLVELSGVGREKER